MLGVICIIDSRFLPFLERHKGIIPEIQLQLVPRALKGTLHVGMWRKGIRINVGMKPFTLHF